MTSRERVLMALDPREADRVAIHGVRKMPAEDRCEIEDEIHTKFAAAMPGGGYIYHSDHCVPDAVSFEQYCRVMELVEQYGAY